MKIKPFRLERYFAKYEFKAPYLLSASDCEPLTLKELLDLADDETRGSWDELWLGYTESQGLPKLREEVTKLYSQIAADEVLVVVPEEGIFIAMNTILEKGDHVIVTYPGYQSLYQLAESIGCEVARWIPEEEKGWKFDIEKLKDLIKANTKLLVINFPHNPTGAMLAHEELEQIIELAKSKDIYVFSDEMYRFLEYQPKDRLISASDTYERAVSLFGMSKTFALAGLRIGWIVTRDKALFKKMMEFKDYTTICSSAPSEVLALMALRSKEKIVERNLNFISENLQILDDFLSKSQKFSWVKPKAGTIGFVKLHEDIKVEDFCLDLVESKGVMLLPATEYGYEGNNFRVGFGRKNMIQALERLEEFNG